MPDAIGPSGVDNRLWTAGLAGGLVGGALVLTLTLWQQRNDSVGNPDAALTQAQTSDRSSELAVQVANLELAQRRLQDELQQLRGRVGASSDLFTETSADKVEQTAGLAAPNQERANPAGVRPTVASAELLVAAGVPETDADEMIARLDALALERLEANFRVRSASADDVNQARLDRRAIPQDSAAIREEFGESAYDRYLYALERPNRVAVASVLRESSAEVAGLEQGDFLRSLDGEPLYSVRDLTERVRQGAPDQTYALVVERNGETIETWVPGGPLGVRVSGELVEPP